MMNSIRIIFLAFIVSGMFLIFAIPSSQNASGFETQGAKGFDMGLPIHQDITRDGLNFLKPGPLNSIVSQHVKIEQYPASPNHFDNCQFSETVNRINARYYAAVEYLNPQNPNLPLAEENFGYILHAAQDFYSHTNWVDMGRTDLIDPWLGYWHPLNSYTITNNAPPVLILEEDGKPYYDFQIYTHGKTITVNHEMWDADGTGKKMGLISGTYDADVSKCPPSASIPHGGAISTITDRLYPDESRVIPDELNKDNPARQGFGSARILAVAQTTHEFCRLVDLAKQKYGDKGVQFINSNWVQDQYLIDSPANNSRCPSSQTQIGSNLELPVNEINNSTILFGDLNEQCQTSYGAGAYYDKTQNACLPPSGDWSNPGNDYLTMQCQNNYGASSYYNSTQNVCLPLSDSWSNPGDDYITMQCQNNYGPDTYYDKTQNACLPPSGSWGTPTSTPGVSSNDDLKSLYQISKQYEKATSSLLTLNDNQAKSLNTLTASSWYKNSANSKNLAHAKLLDLMIQKQSMDKKNIQQVLDDIKEISNKIKDYAQNQGVDPSILDQIDSETQNNANSNTSTTLQQSAGQANADVNAAIHGQQSGAGTVNNESVLLGQILGDNSPLEKLRSGEFDAALFTGSESEASLIDDMKSLLTNYRDQLTQSEIQDLTDLLNSMTPSQGSSGEKNKQDGLGIVQHTVESLNYQEQNETDSILNYITDTGMLDLTPDVNRQAVSTGDLKSLYQISKQYEKATSSLLTLNDYQTRILSGLTLESWYANSDQEKTVHAQVLDLMIRKQSVDKNSIQQILDGMKEISDKIRGYAQNQGTDPSILDQIDSETQNNVPTMSASPTALKQAADAEKINVNAAEKETKSLTEVDKMELANQLSKILGSDESLLEKFRSGELSVFDIASIQSLLADHTSELTNGEIIMLQLTLKNLGYVAPHTNDLDRMQQTIDSLHNQEQNQTDSILNYITDTGMLDLTPIKKTTPQVQNTSSVPQTPSVSQTPPITEIPLGFSVPSQVVQEATSSAGAIVSFTTSFSSPPGSSQIITCNPTSGSQFPLGNTVVKCVETDLSNQKTLEKSFTVSVVDTTGPAISPFNPHNDTPDDSGAIVYFTTEAIDLVDGQVTVQCDHQSGTKFPFGTTVVTCTADDSKGNHSERKLGITITKS